jgi:hypothetical protein
MMLSSADDQPLLSMMLSSADDQPLLSRVRLGCKHTAIVIPHCLLQILQIRLRLGMAKYVLEPNSNT